MILNRSLSLKFLLLLNFLYFSKTSASPQSFLDNIINGDNRMLARAGIKRTNFNFNDALNGRLLVTNLDQLRGLFVLARRFSLWQFSRDLPDMYQSNREGGKIQPVVPDNVPFPCNSTVPRSAKPPDSVHRLRPGDIDIIAAFGDSLSAGNGIISTSINHIMNEYRGYVFSAGGIGNWRNTLTLPNILKIFNPHLYGYSTGDGLTVDTNSHLNIAEPMLMSRDLPFQATVLVARLRRDPHVDMKRHWKLLTIFIGSNDVCSDMCHHDSMENFLLNHDRDLRRTLTILRDRVPRMLVNLLPAPNMAKSLRTMHNVPLICQAVHSGGCHCVISMRYNATYMRRVSKIMQRWQNIEKLVANLTEFQTNDFAVVYHPFTEAPTMRSLPNGDTDLRFYAADCFHLSQMGHATLANTLWNSMLQPIGQKKKDVTYAFEHFECPSKDRPYIATIGNS